MLLMCRKPIRLWCLVFSVDGSTPEAVCRGPDGNLGGVSVPANMRPVSEHDYFPPGTDMVKKI